MRVRMLQDWVFTHGDRAPIELRAGDFFFLDDDTALEWIRMGIAQTEAVPYPPAPVPVLVDPQGRPLGRDACA